MRAKRIYFFGIVFICVFFVSCIEVQEYLTVSKKNIKINFRIALQKSLFAVADIDIDEVFPLTFNDDEFESKMNKSYLTNFDIEDSDLERTLVIGLEAPIIRKESEVDTILPVKTGKGYQIPLLPLSEQADVDSQSNAFTAAILSSSKYRIIIDKTMIKNISAAVLHSPNETIPLPVIDWDSIFVLDISMGVIFMVPEGSYIEIW